jgi:YD repeat-containing protein
MKNSLLLSGLLLSLLFLFTNCRTDSTSNPDNTTTEKKLHFKEQWVYPPPNFDTLLFSYIEEYDMNGQMIDQKKHAIKGGLAIHTMIKYNEHGDMISKVVKNVSPPKEYVNTWEIEYTDGKMSKSIEKNTNGSFENTYSYQKDGSYTINITQDTINIATMVYNKDDKILKSIRKGSNITDIYEYDEQGTLVKKTTEIGDNPPTVLEYSNEYFENGDLKKTTAKGRSHEFSYNEDGEVKIETWYRDEQKYRIIEYRYKYY